MGKLGRSLGLVAAVAALTLSTPPARAGDDDVVRSAGPTSDSPRSDSPPSDGRFSDAPFSDVPSEAPSSDVAYYQDAPPPDGYDPHGEFALGIGYTRIDFDDGGALLEGRDGIHFNPVVSFAPFEGLRQLRLGAGVGWSIALDDTRGALVSRDGQLFFASSSDVTFMLLEPELRVSWRQWFGEDEAFYVEPGVAVGAAFGWLDVGDSTDDPPSPADDNSFSDWDGGFAWKAFLRAGTRVSDGLAGIEMHYMAAERLEWGDDLGGDPEEFYIGIFGSLRF